MSELLACLKDLCQNLTMSLNHCENKGQVVMNQNEQLLFFILTVFTLLLGYAVKVLIKGMIKS